MKFVGYTLFIFFTKISTAQTISINSKVVYIPKWPTPRPILSSYPAACSANTSESYSNGRPGSCSQQTGYEGSCSCIFNSSSGDIESFNTVQRVNLCPIGMTPDGSGGYPTNCTGVPAKFSNCPAVGNPINPITGNKFQQEQDLPSINGLGITRHYNSRLGSQLSFGAELINFGVGWSSSVESKRLLIGTTDILIIDGNGDIDPWSNATGAWVSTSNSENRVWNDNDHYYVRRPDNRVETYDRNGRLLTIDNQSDLHLSYIYNSTTGRLESVANQYGQSLQITTNELGRIVSIERSTGETVTYDYDSFGRLSQITFDDNTRRQYHYEGGGGLLTGITNENNDRYVSWSYDTLNRANSSENVNATDRTVLEYLSDTSGPYTRVTNSLGKQTTYRYITINGHKKITQVEGHASANCAGANQAYTYDTNGFMASSTDWQGNITTYIHNDRGQELSRTEASGTPQARTITTEWHTQFNLPVRIIEPERETTMAYDANGQLLNRQIRALQQ